MSGDDNGSVLVEALVSTAIVATILGAAYQVVADSTARHQKVEARRYAVMIARSQLARAGSEVPLQTGAVEGADAGYRWRMDISPCEGGASSAGLLYCVAVSVRSPAERAPLVTLQTRRLAPLA